MCGIAGVYGTIDEDSVRRMIDTQIHRGPDDSGIWSDPEIPAVFGIKAANGFAPRGLQEHDLLAR